MAWVSFPWHCCGGVDVPHAVQEMEFGSPDVFGPGRAGLGFPDDGFAGIVEVVEKRGGPDGDAVANGECEVEGVVVGYDPWVGRIDGRDGFEGRGHVDDGKVVQVFDGLQ